jgi:phosphoglycerate dehydrogenase-like enzyme
MANIFRVGLTRDFLTPAGELAMGDIGLRALENVPGVSYEFFPEYLPEVTPKQIAGYDAVISLAPRYTRRTVQGANLRLSLLARFGVGYDMIDVGALTEREVILTITPDGVRRPMAAGIVTLMLALAHELFAKDRLVRQRKWAERLSVKASGLTGRVLGSIGVGNIGRELFRLAQPFDMVHLAVDPHVSAEDVASLSIRLVDLETLMRESDFVCVNCPLTPETRGLVGERELSWMKPTAYFINTSRGPIVDPSALYGTLKERRIRGAALDVFSVEPLRDDDPLIELDNVILTPHSLCWTDECFRSMGESAACAVLSVLRGEIPPNVVNRHVLDRPGVQAKLEANRRRWQFAVEGSSV